MSNQQRYAVWFTGPEQVDIRLETRPQPAPGQLLVETILSAVSAGTELLLYRGQMPLELGVDDTIDALGEQTAAYPLKYGYASVGRVTAVGDGVDAAWRGRHVFAFQPHQSYFTAAPDEVHLLPDGVEPADAVFLPNMETAVSFVMDGRPVVGERTAVIGLGVVGLLTTAVLARHPLAGLAGVEPAAPRRRWAKRWGATAVVDGADADVGAQVRAALGGEADLVYELSGNPAALDTAVACAGFDSRVVIGSWYGRKRAAVDLGGRFHRSHMRLVSSQVSRLHPRWLGRWTKSRRLDTAWEMIREIRPSQLITDRVPPADVPRLYARLAAGETAGGQAVIVWHSDGARP